ncbi:MAG: hypothetical protein R3248_00755 [Candidatus Promineifilaceae bacterium]|nr:hypothetical protein [Candidatus Promineifilaceae bacterium]
MLKVLLLAFGHDLHRAIPFIAYPSGNVSLLCVAPRRIAEKDTLNVSINFRYQAYHFRY